MWTIFNWNPPNGCLDMWISRRCQRKTRNVRTIQHLEATNADVSAVVNDRAVCTLHFNGDPNWSFWICHEIINTGFASRHNHTFARQRDILKKREEMRTNLILLCHYHIYKHIIRREPDLPELSHCGMQKPTEASFVNHRLGSNPRTSQSEASSQGTEREWWENGA